MSRLSPRQARDVVTVTPASSSGTWGSTAAQPVPVRCRFVLTQKAVRASDGTDTVATAELQASPQLNPGKDLLALFTPGATVTRGSVTRRVVGVTEGKNRGRLVFVAATLT